MEVVCNVNHLCNIGCSEGLHDRLKLLDLMRAHTVKSFCKCVEITDACVFTELVIHAVNIAVVVGDEVFLIADPINADVF